MDDKKKFATIRIIVGCAWAIDAYFKWQPDFFTNIAVYVSQGAKGQPPLIQAWIGFWSNVVGIHPLFFAYLVAISETAIAIGLIFGLFTRVTLWGGIFLSLAIWSTAEGFGGPYAAGSTDIGTAIIYALMLISLLVGQSWQALSIDALRKKIKS